MLEPGCTLANLANISRQKTTNTELYDISEGKKPAGNVARDVAGGPYVVFTKKAIVVFTSIRKPMFMCESSSGVSSSQICSYSRCQSMAKTIYRSWVID